MLDHVDCWVFDLDNTLYPRECDLFVQVDYNMGGYISRLLGVHHDDARHIQKLLFREYGTTLNGLMRVYGIDPAEFLACAHDIDVSVAAPDPALDAALHALPGRKLIYTNATVAHAENVLDRLGLAHHFEAVFDIVAADYAPKPNRAPYEAFLRRCAVDPRRAAMFEDMARNLLPAHALGMATVWLPTADTISADGRGDHIDHVTHDLAGFLTRVAAARNGG